MQFLADMLGVPVDRPADLESTALGAAFAAGWQAGVYPGPESFADRRRRDRVFTPAMDEGDEGGALPRLARRGAAGVVSGRVSHPDEFQAFSKFSQIQPSRAKFSLRISKENAWISLDSLVRFEPFQWVGLTPWALFLSWRGGQVSRRLCDICGRMSTILFSRLVPRVEIVEHVVHGKSILPEIQIFRKELSRNLWAPARLRELLKRDPKRVRRFLKDQREKLTGVAKREATKYLIGAELDCLVASLLAMTWGGTACPQPTG